MNYTKAASRGRAALFASAGLAALVLSTAATAQDAQPSDEAVSAQDEDEAIANTITVTGSRIKLPNVDTFEPVVVLDDQYIQERNLTNVADALNELPGFRGSVTPNGAQGSFGQGVNFVNNLGLGSNRTLTLVNGRRFVSSNVPTLFNQGSAGTQVDLNVIPSALVDRIDTVSVGGAPVYGSDAISGTVNVILKTKFDGVDISGTTGITDEGDGFFYNTTIVAGRNFLDDRLNVTLSYARDRQDGILSNQRAFLRDNVGGATNPSSAQAAGLFNRTGVGLNDGRVNPFIGFNNTATDGFPGTILVRDLTIPFLTQGGLITATNGGANAVSNNFQFDSNGNVVPFNRGIGFVGINSTGAGQGSFRFSDFGQLRSDLERDIFNGFMNFEITPNVTMFFEGTYFRSRGDELVQQPTFNSSLFGGLSGPLTFTIDSPFLNDQARSTLAARGVTLFQVSRASTDLADVTGYSKNQLYRGVLGFRGDFEVGGRSYDFEVSGNYGETDILDVRQDLNAQNFINAVNVTRNTAGQIVCTATPARQAAPGGTPIADPNCVPLNLLGFGRADPRALDYVISENRTNSELQQWVINASVTGSPFDIFGNPVGFVVGYEHRNERGSFTPSDFEQRGLGRSVAIAPVSGEYNLDEVFGEVLVPLVTPGNGLSFINRLEVYGRGRYVDNTVNGGFFSWAAGGVFAPIPDIAFRGNYTKSFRSPAITELFLPVSNSFVTVPDLCSPANRNAGAAPTVRNANCTAFLTAFPNATPLDAASATVPGRSGGNSSLQNEKADSYTFGVVLQPRFLPNFTATVDYIDIKIDDPIANLTVAQIASACFDNSDFNASDPANGNAFCSLIRRYATGQGGTAANGGDRGGQVVADPQNPGVTSGFINGNQIKFSGIQAVLDWSEPVDYLGPNARIELGGDLLYVRRRLIDNTGVAPQRSDGTVGDPEFSAQLNVRYVDDNFGTTVSMNYIGEQLLSRTNRGTQPSDIREFDQYEDYVTMNLSTYFDVADTFRLTLAVTNLFNRQGQDYYGVLIPGSVNDAFGRRYSVGARMIF